MISRFQRVHCGWAATQIFKQIGIITCCCTRPLSKLLLNAKSLCIKYKNFVHVSAVFTPLFLEFKYYVIFHNKMWHKLDNWHFHPHWGLVILLPIYNKRQKLSFFFASFHKRDIKCPQAWIKMTTCLLCFGQ